MNWQPVYAILILFSTVVTYFCAYKIEQTTKKSYRKNYLVASILINLSILFLFKYYNFFNTSVFGLLDDFGLRIKLPDFKYLLPVGISFYTFQAVGYTVDVYRGDVKHEKHFGIYALFVSFFPQLVAGPIERAKNLLPQFKAVKKFNHAQAVEGIKLMIWGFFMKLVVADRVAIYVNSVYGNSDQHTSVTLITATIFFAVQIYCDFAGYSNIAIGCAKIMGFDLMRNFRRPYFAQSCSEFWQRWHISLSTWFRDYVYIPLGGNRVSKKRNFANLLLTFVVSGLWHGANWTYIIWGALNGLYQIIFKILKFNPSKKSSKQKSLFTYILNVLLTFILICFSWIFFRADSFSHASEIIIRIGSEFGPLFKGDNSSFAFGVFGILFLFLKDGFDEFYPTVISFFEVQIKSLDYSRMQL